MFVITFNNNILATRNTLAEAFVALSNLPGCTLTRWEDHVWLGVEE